MHCNLVNKFPSSHHKLWVQVEEVEPDPTRLKLKLGRAGFEIKSSKPQFNTIGTGEGNKQPNQPRAQTHLHYKEGYFYIEDAMKRFLVDVGLSTFLALHLNPTSANRQLNTTHIHMFVAFNYQNE